MFKKIAFTVYAIVIFVMAMATIMEKTKGTPFVLNNVYGSWWFTSLWALLAISGIIYIVGRQLKKEGLLLLHLSFVVILTGALLSHLTAWQGMVHLRRGEPVKSCFVDGKEGKYLHELPFTITLDKFSIRY
ncbi:MAG: cytochrome c biogenesis protein ResB, partial [Bacteroidaceae bacterium]|nr:cytochrome c biogenesis protein ResB [Bacteroidaceae bacterium]